MSYPLVDAISIQRNSTDSNWIFLSQQKFIIEAPNILFLLTTSAVFFAIRYFVKYHVWRPFAIACGLSKRSLIARFTESAWYTCYYTTFLIFGCVVYLLEDWGPNTTHMWIGWPLQPFKPLLKVYYLMELTFYFHCLVALTFEKRRKDFNLTLIHHLSTFALVGMSYWVRYFRVGLLILIVHNISDVFLYLSKSMHYISYVQPKWKNITNQMFTVFGVSFFLSRLVLLPVLVWSAHVESAMIIGPSQPVWWETNIALKILLVLHLNWFYLIIRMASKLKAAGDEFVSDVRSDDSEEEDEPAVVDKKTKKNK